MTRKRKDYRELKVSSFSGYGYKSAPMLRIQGLWLEELGFNIGDPILVKCEDGKLIITVDHAREDAETKEQAFLDEEMKKLQKKFEVEKKKIYQQVVAERKVRYTYKLLPGAEDRIYDKISDITISMKGTDYLEMPELISTEYKVYLDDTEKAKYEALRDEFVLQLPGGEITASNAATLSGKLSQLANGAIYSDDGDVNIFHERKLDALEDLIEAANGKPVLVAYWFKHDLRRISERLSNLGIDYQQLDSDASIKKWNAGQLQVGLIHPASAGHGLNLQSGGNILVWFGITWSLELYQQTVARLWRQGQTEGTVSVIHIVTDGTVDERILKALEAKDLTQSALIDAVKAEVGDGK